MAALEPGLKILRGLRPPFPAGAHVLDDDTSKKAGPGVVQPYRPHAVRFLGRASSRATSLRSTAERSSGVMVARV